MKPTTTRMRFGPISAEHTSAHRRALGDAVVTVACLIALCCLVAALLPGVATNGHLRNRTLDAPLVLAGSTQRVAPGQSIQAAIDAVGPQSTVVIGSGVHTGQSFTPRNDMVITGEAGAVLDGTGAPLPYAIYGDASNVTVSHLEIRNYTKPIWGPNNYRHQGAIHGASMNGGGGFIAIARNWRIENNNIHNNAGWGVSPGDGFTVVQNSLHHNGMAGIGGGDFNGGLFEKNDIYANNDPSNSLGDFNYDTGRPWDWAWNAAGIKVANVNCRSLGSTGSCSSGTPLIIRSNNVHDNAGVGIWCDINCNDVTIEKNLVERNIGVDSIGIFYEISQNARIRDNVVRDQGSSGNYLNPSGILVWSSDGVMVERNQVEGTANAIVGNARPREFNRTLRNLTVRDNVILTQGRATRVGIASDTATDFKSAGNSFNNNYYDNTSKMTFWWTDISRGESTLNLDQWRGLGFTPAAAPPASPTTPAVIAPAASPTAAPKAAAPSTNPKSTPASTTPATSTTTSTSTSTSTTTQKRGSASTSSTTSGDRSNQSTTLTTTAASETARPNGDASPITTPTATSLPVGRAPAETASAETAPAETVPAETVPAETVPAETAPEALAFAPSEEGIDADRSIQTDENETAAQEQRSETATTPPDDGLELGIGVDTGQPTPASAALRALIVLGFAIAGVVMWLASRSLSPLARRSTKSDMR